MKQQFPKPPATIWKTEYKGNKKYSRQTKTTQQDQSTIKSRTIYQVKRVQRQLLKHNNMQINKPYKNQHGKNKQANSRGNMFRTKEQTKSKSMEKHKRNNSLV